MGAQKPDALIPNVSLWYAFENTSADDLLPRFPTPAGSARGDRTAGQRQRAFNFSSSGAAGPARGTPGGKHRAAVNVSEAIIERNSD